MSFSWRFCQRYQSCRLFQMVGCQALMSSFPEPHLSLRKWKRFLLLTVGALAWRCSHFHKRMLHYILILVTEAKIRQREGKERNWSCLVLFSSEKAVALHSITLAWKIPWTEEPGRLRSTGSLRLGHSRATSLSLFTFMPWRRKWQPTPVFLPGESQGRGSLMGCCLWGHTELDTTDMTQQQQQCCFLRMLLAC